MLNELPLLLVIAAGLLIDAAMGHGISSAAGRTPALRWFRATANTSIAAAICALARAGLTIVGAPVLLILVAMLASVGLILVATVWMGVGYREMFRGGRPRFLRPSDSL